MNEQKGVGFVQNKCSQIKNIKCKSKSVLKEAFQVQENKSRKTG